MFRMIFLRRCFFLFIALIGSISNLFGYEQKRIVVVIPSYNNTDWYKKNLDSVFSQNYENYSIIYVDDDSPDGTGDLVEQYLEKRELQNKCLLIKNEIRYGQLFNRYKAIHLCDDDDIIVLLDGDDWLQHDEVFSYLNNIYQEENVLLTVGNACRSTSGKKIGYRDHTQEEIEQLGFRQLGFRGVHPRTFYAGLFKKVQVQDLMHCGRFLMVATDVAFLLPMFEMAQDRYKYIHDILYVYNDENPINLYKFKFERQIYFDLITRNRKPYAKLSNSFKNEQSQCDKSVSYILFMEEETNTEPFLQSQYQKGVQFDTCVQIGNGDPYKRRPVHSYFQSYHSLNIGYSLDKIYHFRFNFKKRFLKTILECEGEYLLVSTQKMLADKNIDVSECIKQLKGTGAFGVMFGKGDMHYLKEHSYDVAPWGVDQNLYLFNLWMYQNIFTELSDCYGMLLRKTDFIDLINQLEIFHPNFYTLLAACNSVLGQESMFLIAHNSDEGVI